MFEVGVARPFEALHQLEGESADPEHHHDYRVEAVVRGESLDENGMLLDIDALNAALATCLDELDSVDLATLPAFIGRNTTVEVVAEHVCDHVRRLVGSPSNLDTLRVSVYESAAAWATIERDLAE
jgi:6-pyruvoyltetrahydropterin/6-carboxytetrahydropterin synthase